MRKKKEQYVLNVPDDNIYSTMKKKTYERGSELKHDTIYLE